MFVYDFTCQILYHYRHPSNHIFFFFFTMFTEYEGNVVEGGESTGYPSLDSSCH